MNNKRLIHVISKFAESCTAASKKRGRIRGVEKYYQAYFNERQSNTIVELDNKNAIKAVATYEIVHPDGKNYFVFTTFFSKSGTKGIKNIMRRIKSYGFDQVCILREDWSLLCLN